MTSRVDVDENLSDSDGAPDRARANVSPASITVVAICAVALLILAGVTGYLIHPRNSAPSSPPVVSSVDAGFARDMATHHTQAVSMSGYARDNSADPAVTLLAFDIETSQQFQLGQMDGWLTSWGLSRTSNLAEMSWMGTTMQMQANGLMPGRATPAEVANLKTLKGTALDTDYLQLMLRHHQGGVQMANYAAEHAETGYVQALARAMSTAQQNEIIEMEQMLRARNAAPLPAS